MAKRPQLRPGDLVHLVRSDQTVSDVPYVVRSVSGFHCTISELLIVDGRKYQLCKPQDFDTSMLVLAKEDRADRRVRLIKTGFVTEGPAVLAALLPAYR